ncbi:hypothetical protein DSB75_11735 [Salmonella enterica subsp. enterica serovar Typhimurium]|nr:hypothetical protein DSB75_11735 [Salmonella enterica subsp. enterica serovar Typhimurium]
MADQKTSPEYAMLPAGTIVKYGEVGDAPVICNAHAFSELSTQNTSLRTLPLSLLTRQTLLINIKI